MKIKLNIEYFLMSKIRECCYSLFKYCKKEIISNKKIGRKNMNLNVFNLIWIKIFLIKVLYLSIHYINWIIIFGELRAFIICKLLKLKLSDKVFTATFWIIWIFILNLLMSKWGFKLRILKTNKLWFKITIVVIPN